MQDPMRHHATANLDLFDSLTLEISGTEPRAPEYRGLRGTPEMQRGAFLVQWSLSVMFCPPCGNVAAGTVQAFHISEPRGITASLARVSGRIKSPPRARRRWTCPAWLAASWPRGEGARPQGIKNLLSLQRPRLATEHLVKLVDEAWL